MPLLKLESGVCGYSWVQCEGVSDCAHTRVFFQRAATVVNTCLDAYKPTRLQDVEFLLDPKSFSHEHVHHGQHLPYLNDSSYSLSHLAPIALSSFDSFQLPSEPTAPELPLTISSPQAQVAEEFSEQSHVPSELPISEATLLTLTLPAHPHPESQFFSNAVMRREQGGMRGRRWRARGLGRRRGLGRVMGRQYAFVERSTILTWCVSQVRMIYFHELIKFISCIFQEHRKYGGMTLMSYRFEVPLGGAYNSNTITASRQAESNSTTRNAEEEPREGQMISSSFYIVKLCPPLYVVLPSHESSEDSLPQSLEEPRENHVMPPTEKMPDNVFPQPGSAQSAVEGTREYFVFGWRRQTHKSSKSYQFITFLEKIVQRPTLGAVEMAAQGLSSPSSSNPTPIATSSAPLPVPRQPRTPQLLLLEYQLLPNHVPTPPFSLDPSAPVSRSSQLDTDLNFLPVPQSVIEGDAAGEGKREVGVMRELAEEGGREEEAERVIEPDAQGVREGEEGEDEAAKQLTIDISSGECFQCYL